jgi:hypothetical protein
MFQENPDAGKADNVDGKQQEMLKILNSQADFMEQVPFTSTEYNRLFPFGRIKSPIETVKIGANQYEKLKITHREKYLGAMRQTLKDPVIIIEETVNGEKSHLYIKSFKSAGNKHDFVMSVVVSIGNENIAISTGPRKEKQIIKKMAGNPLYIRGGDSPTAGTAGGSPSTLPVTPLSPDSVEKSSGGKTPDVAGLYVRTAQSADKRMK